MKSIKISYVILKIYLAHLIIGMAIMGPNWYISPTTEQEISMASTSELLLLIAVILYLFPLFSIYETAVKENSGRKKLQEILENGAEVEVIVPEEIQRKWAETGNCNCKRCTDIRAKIEKEKSESNTSEK